MKDFGKHSSEWRDPAQVIAQWRGASDTDPGLLTHRVRGRWWETLEELRITLLVTRETEHLIVAMRANSHARETTFLRLPHPSGLAVDRDRHAVYVASTRNPNLLYELAIVGDRSRMPERGASDSLGVLMPIASRTYPGSLYLHDLAVVGGRLLGNAVGHNTVVEFGPDSSATPVWWPRSIEVDGRPTTEANYLQLNSIAAGENLAGSFFSASTAIMARRRPGHINFAVDGRGVIFSGRTREPAVTGLTRPHSARLHQGVLWVDNSGYGTVGRCADGKYEVVARLGGWTRGLCLVGDIAFVGTSRVIPRFRAYAPGLDVDSSECGVHAIDLTSGTVIGSLIWPSGNQIFAIDAIDSAVVGGFPFRTRRAPKLARQLFYDFERRPSTPGEYRQPRRID